MSSIGSTTGIGIKTFDLSYLPQFLQIGGPDATFNLNALTIVARGKTLVQLTDSTQILAISQVENSLMGSMTTTLGSRFFLADGRIEGQSTITVNSSSATPETYYANSLKKSKSMTARNISVSPVVANGNGVYSDFDLLMFDGTFVERVQVTYENGYTEELTVAEVNGLFCSISQTLGNGTIQGQSVLLGYRAPMGFKIKTAVIYAGASNANVLVSSFQQI